MRVIARPALRNFAERFPDTETALNAWWKQMRGNDYASPHDLRTAFPGVDFLGDGLTVFDIRGNNCRVIASVNYRAGIVFIKHVFTHAEYDGWSDNRRKGR